MEEAATAIQACWRGHVVRDAIVREVQAEFEDLFRGSGVVLKWKTQSRLCRPIFDCPVVTVTHDGSSEATLPGRLQREREMLLAELAEIENAMKQRQDELNSHGK